jgi:hypothetical protein
VLNVRASKIQAGSHFGVLAKPLTRYAAKADPVKLLNTT